MTSPLTRRVAQTLAATILGFSLVGGAAAQEESGTKPVGPPPPPALTATVSFEKVSDSCWAAIRSDGGANAGFIVGEESVLVIDSLGHPRLAEQLRDKIKEITKKPITAVVHTQWHYEHTLGNQVFGDEIDVLMGAKAAEKLGRRLRADGLLLGPGGGAHASLNIRKVRAASDVIESERKFDLGGIEVVASVVGECRSVEDLVVWVPSEKVLYTGSLVSNGHHPLLNAGSTFRTIDRLARLEKLPIERAVPGHGEVGDKELLATQRKYLMQLRAAVRHLGRRKMTVDEIIEKYEMPTDYRDLGHAAAWKDNVRFVVQEVFTGR